MSSETGNRQRDEPNSDIVIEGARECNRFWLPGFAYGLRDLAAVTSSANSRHPRYSPEALRTAK